MNRLSVVIITLNEERNIGRCIASVRNVADEVLVVDSFSTDQTPAICAQLGARFIQLPWKGYAQTKNEGNRLATYDWILSLDADEALSEKLAESIIKLKQHVMFPASFSRVTQYNGKWIWHGGWYPDVKFRLFNRNHCSWRGSIHEVLDFFPGKQETVHKLDGDCLHFSFYSVAEHKKQAAKFAALQAEEWIQSGKKPGKMKAFFAPFSKFFQMYVLKAGFLDGFTGFQIAWISATAAGLKYKIFYQLLAKKN